MWRDGEEDLLLLDFPKLLVREHAFLQLTQCLMSVYIMNDTTNDVRTDCDMVKFSSQFSS